MNRDNLKLYLLNILKTILKIWEHPNIHRFTPAGGKRGVYNYTMLYVRTYLWKLSNDEIEKLFLKQIEISSSFIFWRFSYKDHILIFVEKFCLNQLHRKQYFIIEKRSFCKSRTAFIRKVRIGFIIFKM